MSLMPPGLFSILRKEVLKGSKGANDVLAKNCGGSWLTDERGHPIGLPNANKFQPFDSGTLAGSIKSENAGHAWAKPIALDG